MVDAVGFRNYGVYNSPEPTEVNEAKAYRNNSGQTYSTKVNFEGRRDYDYFEKNDDTVKNVAIGTGIAAVALYALAAFAGKKGFKFKGDNWFAKTGNTCTEKAFESAKWLKKHTWDKLVNLFKSDKKQGA